MAYRLFFLSNVVQATSGLQAVLLIQCCALFFLSNVVQATEGMQAPGVDKLHEKAGFLEELGYQKLNSQQRQAVASVLVGAGGGTLPLALFGPPGTGKTVTLVECALQVNLSSCIDALH